MPALSPTAPPIVSDYWHRILTTGDVVSDDGHTRITINPSLDAARAAMILRRTDGSTRAALSPVLAARAGIVAGEDASMGIADFRRRLAASGTRLHHPDLVFYLHDVPTPSTAPGEPPRRLTLDDGAAFATFVSQAAEQDLDDAFVELDHWAVFGRYEGERLVSAASAYPWHDAAIADLGVLTLPDARGRGHARAVVAALCRFSRRQGHEPQYRCQIGNAASVALAGATGFVPFGEWEVVAA